MPEDAADLRFAVFDRWWGHRHLERAFVARTVAGALACHGRVDILVPGPPGPARPDGAFDVVPVGGDGAPGATWARAADAALPDRRYDAALVVVDGGVPDHDGGAFPLAARVTGRVLALPVGAADEASHGPASSAGPPGLPGAPAVEVVSVRPGPTGAGGGGGGSAVHRVGFAVAVSPEARAAPFNGIGCSDYVLVLGGTPPPPAEGTGPGPDALPAAARWAIARFPRAFVLTVVEGTVTVWRHRSPLGSLPVGTRMDLWRLMAFARVTVDPRPGPVVARECVESLMVGTPVVVPAGGVGADLAAGSGAVYGNVAELLEALDALSDRAVAGPLADHGRRAALERFGSWRSLVDALGAVVATAPPHRGSHRRDGQG